MSEYIEHPGIVKEILNHNTVIVSITSTSACANCRSKAACTMGISEIKEKEVEVQTNAKDFPIGTKVMVRMPLQAGAYAVLLSYVVPLVILMFTVIVVFNVTNNELLAGLLSLLALVPYFLFLYFMQRKIKKQISFEIRKCVET